MTATKCSKWYQRELDDANGTCTDPFMIITTLGTDTWYDNPHKLNTINILILLKKIT